jgi:hypothetical protein
VPRRGQGAGHLGPFVGSLAILAEDGKVANRGLSSIALAEVRARFHDKIHLFESICQAGELARIRGLPCRRPLGRRQQHAGRKAA